MLDEYLRLEHGDNKESTRESAVTILEGFGDAVGWPDARSIDKETFRKVWPKLKVGRGPKTQANWLGEIGHFARWLENEDVIVVDFTRGVKRPPRRLFGTHDEIYEEEWYQPIWDALEHWARPRWEDHWFTALDNMDLYQLQPRKHILKVSDGCKIWKERAKEPGCTIDQPLPSQIKARWLARREECGPNDVMYPDSLRYADADSWGGQFRKELHRAQAKLGIPLLDVKVTRHTFTTRHLMRFIRGEKNAPTFDQLRRWLGHSESSREVERTYAKLVALTHLMD